MSDVSNDFPIADDDDLGQIGQTSEGEVVQEEPQRLPWFHLNLFSAMLLISFVLITVSTMLMLWHLTTRFGSIFDGPWNV